MSEPVEFPVPADDLRFLKRAERSRSPPPPAKSRDPPERSEASIAAEPLLRKYVMYTGPPREPRKKRQWPEGIAAVVCLLFAAALVPLELIYLMMCRPELRGRRLRGRFVTPRDVQRVLFLRTLPVRILLNRFRV